MTSPLVKILVVLAVTSLITACKLAVIVPSGGDVVTEFGNANCVGGSLCEFNIPGPRYYRFAARPRLGYEFVKWNPAPGFLCADSTDPKCIVQFPAPDGNEGIVNAYAGGQHVYLMPIFNYVGVDTDLDSINDDVDGDDDGDGIIDSEDSCPLNPQPDPQPSCASITGDDLITADGKVWAQKSLFAGLAAVDILLACPSSQSYNCTGMLNGHDMTGWTWANRAAIRSLLNSYGAGIPDVGTTSYIILNTEWKDLYYDAGWQGEIEGLEAANGAWIDAYKTLVTTNGSGQDWYRANLIAHPLNSKLGGWFYRAPE